ncbi:hypothetical protein [Pseudomonas putida]
MIDIDLSAPVRAYSHLNENSRSPFGIRDQGKLIVQFGQPGLW